DLLESCIGNPRHDCSGSRLTRPLQNGDRRRSPLSRRTKTMKHLSRILFLVGLTASLLLSAGVANAADPTAIKVALKADSGNLLARCHGCVPNGAYPDNAAVHVPASQLTSAIYAQFYLQKLANGKYAL